MSISQDWITNELEDTELEALHRSPSVEYSFYNAVRAGDMEAVNKNCEEDSFLHLKGTGILSKNPLTNLKYHFVVTTAMLTRYCIDEKMKDWDTAKEKAAMVCGMMAEGIPARHQASETQAR